MPRQDLYVGAGQKHYVGGTITETNGADISADPILVALGQYSTPPDKTSATTPSSDTQGATTATRVVKLLIDNTTPAAVNQYIWAWITDNPEIEPLRLDGPINIIT